MLQEASMAERIVLILLLAATLISSLIALYTISKRWYLGVGRAVIVGVRPPSTPGSQTSDFTAAARSAPDEKAQLLHNQEYTNDVGSYAELPSPVPGAHRAPSPAALP